MCLAIQGSFKSQTNGKLSSSVEVKSAESKTFAAAKGFCLELKFYTHNFAPCAWKHLLSANSRSDFN